MAHGAFRGAAVAVLGLATLETLLTDHGTEAAGGVVNYINSVLRRALDPGVALIPDFSKGQGGGAGSPNAAGGVTPNYSVPYLPSNAVIQSTPTQLPIMGHPVPN